MVATSSPLIARASLFGAASVIAALLCRSIYNNHRPKYERTEARMTSNGEHSAGAVDDSSGLPVPSAEDQEMLLDVWQEALAQVLADRNNEWEQTVRSTRAESRAAIAELRATIADMRSEICDIVERRVSEKMAQIRQPADGAPGP